MRLNKYVDPFMYVVLVAELLVFSFIAYYAQKEVRVMIKQRLKYFSVSCNTASFRSCYLKMCLANSYFFCSVLLEQDRSVDDPLVRLCARHVLLSRHFR